jgi:Cytochrome bd terminal oxidase subunit I
MDSALLVHRIHFAFTITFHYLFPQLTMGLAPLIVVLKTIGLRRKDETYNQAARFWAKIFGISFLMGVVTGIPMEFQFGTNWSAFSRYAGGVVGQTLAMEGLFAISRTFSVWRKTAQFLGPLGDGRGRLSGIVAFWLFHHRNRRLDATSRRLLQGSRWFVAAFQLLGPSLEPMGVVAICAQHGRGDDDRLYCDVGGRCILSALGEV